MGPPCGRRRLRAWRDVCPYEANAETAHTGGDEDPLGGARARLGALRRRRVHLASGCMERTGGAMHYIGSLVLILWLIIGAVAAGQRHDYSRPPAHCNQVATIAVTILAGPLNYLGVNPEISCHHLPQPSK